MFVTGRVAGGSIAFMRILAEARSSTGPLGFSDVVWAAIVSGLVAIVASTLTTMIVGRQNRRLEELRWIEARRQQVGGHVLSILEASGQWVRNMGSLLVMLESAKSEREANEFMRMQGTDDSRWRISSALAALRLHTQAPQILAAVDVMIAELERKPSIAVPALNALRNGEIPPRAIFDTAHDRCKRIEQLAADVAHAAEPLVAGPLK
jgi:hypothetical protein